MTNSTPCYAIDFGTSNSLLTYVPPSGSPQMIALEGDNDNILRSLLYTPEKNVWYFGQEAIQKYQEYSGEGRFFRSIKKFLAEKNYRGTEIFERKVTIDELVSIFLREMKTRADRICQQEVSKVVLGRPAKYSLDPELDQLAEDRMRNAAALAGFTEIIFCPEPLAAGLDFETTVAGEKIVLIADFGGGTSDFTLLKIHPGKYSSEDVLGISGIFLAGDALDGKIMKNFISTHFGRDFEYKVPFGKNVLQFPRHLLNSLCSPAHITHLGVRDTWEFLKEIQQGSITEQDRKKLDQLFILVEEQLGYPLYHKIENAKINLSSLEKTLFEFKQSGIEIEEIIRRHDFENSVEEIVEKIVQTMLEVFEMSGYRPDQVDHICITGGTAQFPLLKQRLQNIFGAKKLTEHKIFQSVVGGLAQFARI